MLRACLCVPHADRHLNQVHPRDRRAAIPPDRAATRATYGWSSHLDYAGEREPLAWLDLSWLRYWGRTPTQAQAEYRQEIASFFGKPIPSPWDGLRGGLVLGGAALWAKVRGLMGKKEGDAEIRWRARLATEEMADQVRVLVADEPDRRVPTCLPAGRFGRGLRWVASARCTWHRTLAIVMGVALALGRTDVLHSPPTT